MALPIVVSDARLQFGGVGVESRVFGGLARGGWRKSVDEVGAMAGVF